MYSQAVEDLTLATCALVAGGCSEQCYEGHPLSNQTVWQTQGHLALGYSPRDYVVAMQV